MSQNYYDIYLNSTIELVETLVIKSDYTADQINERMSLAHGPGHFEPLDKTTWKYYLNMSGEYHHLDDQIQITSLDTLQPIVFSKQNLAVHRATAEAYRYGSRYYRELVTQYPAQEDLILGVLYPVDIHKAIEAPDMQVVGWAPHLVEENEFSLIKNINSWLEHFSIRWNNKQFVHSDELYMASILGLAALNLVAVILNLRLRACRTSEVHSFHVRQYLASNGMLDVYLDHMTRKQALFFYRNISFIERNAGKQDVFNWLIEKVMTDRQLPLSEFTMKHDASVMPESLTPAVTFRKRLINTEVQSMDRQENFQTLGAILDKEEKIAPGNREYRTFNQARMNELFESSLSSTVSTKVLESSMVDYTDAVPITLHRVLLSNWLYLANTDRFNTLIRINDPRSGEIVTMNAKQAYLYYLYAFCKASGLPVVTIPTLVAERVHCEPLPTSGELLSIVDTKYVKLEDVLFMMTLHPPLRAVTSVLDFRDHAQELHTAALKQMRFVSNQEHHYTRGLMHNVMLRLHSDTTIPHSIPGQTYEDWLTLNELPFADYTEENWSLIYRQVYEQVTGHSLDLTESVGNLQKAMVGLLAKLSSYSIQFVTEVNSASIQIVNWAAVRLGDMSSYGRNFQNLLISAIQFKNIENKSVQNQVLNLEPLINDFRIEPSVHDFGHIEIPLEVKESPKALNHGHTFNIGRMMLDNRWFPEGATLVDWEDVPNFSGFAAMTEEEKADIKTIYGTCFPPIVYPTHADIDDLLLHDQVPGFGYVQARRTYLNMFQYFYAPVKTYLFLNTGVEAEIDGFYSNHGELPSNAFQLNNGHEFADSFKWESTIPSEHVFDSFNFSGGYTFSQHFNAVFTDDTEVQLPGLFSIKHTASPAIMPFYSSLSVDLFKGGPDSRTLVDMKAVQDAKNIGTLQGVYENKSLTGFVGATNTFSFSFVNTFIHDELSTLMIDPVEDSRDILGLVDSYAVHEPQSPKGMMHSRTIPGLINATVSHNSRGVRQWFGVVASLNSIDTVFATRQLGGFKNTMTVRSLPSFRIVMHQRSINAFNWLLGSGDHDVNIKNGYGVLSFTLRTTMAVSTLAMISEIVQRDLADMSAVYDNRNLTVPMATDNRVIPGLVNIQHEWDLQPIDAVEADERDLSELEAVYDHRSSQSLEGVYATRMLALINEHRMRDALVSLLSSHDIHDLSDLDPPEPTPTPTPDPDGPWSPDELASKPTMKLMGEGLEDDGTGHVNGWQDSSDTGGHLARVEAPNWEKIALVPNAINGHAAAVWGTSSSDNHFLQADATLRGVVGRNTNAIWTLVVAKIGPSADSYDTLFHISRGSASYEHSVEVNSSAGGLVVYAQPSSAYSYISTTTAPSNEWAVYLVTANYADQQLTAYKDAVAGSSTSFITNEISVDEAASEMYVGTAHGNTYRLSNTSIACIISGQGNALSSADIDKLFGWAAHRYGLQANLPSNHPYKTHAPGMPAPTPAPGPWLPGELNPVLWMDDSSIEQADGRVDKWSDTEDTTLFMTPLTSAQRPVYLTDAINGLSAVRFGQASNAGVHSTDSRILAVASQKGYAYAFTVMRRLSSDANYGLFEIDRANNTPMARIQFAGSYPTPGNIYTNDDPTDAGGGYNLVSPSNVLPANTWVMALVVWDWENGTVRIIVNSEQVAGNASAWVPGLSSALTSSSGAYLGHHRRAAGYEFRGDIATFILGNERITDTDDVNKLFGWAAHKYGLQAQLPVGHPYKDEPPGGPAPTPEPTDPPETLALNQPPNQATQGEVYQHQFTADGVAPITFEVISGTLPTGTTLTSGGLLSGTVTQAPESDATFIVRATDAEGAIGTRGVTIIVLAAAPPEEQRILNNYNHGVANLEGHESFYGASELPSPITWSISAGALPAGLHLSTLNANYARIWGVPNDDVGYYDVILRAQGSDGQVSFKTVKFALANMLHLLHLDDNIVDQTGAVWNASSTPTYTNAEPGFGKKLVKGTGGWQINTPGTVMGSDFCIDFTITMAAPLGGSEQYAWVINQDRTAGTRPFQVLVDVRTNTFWFTTRDASGTVSLNAALPTGTTRVRCERSGTTGRVYFNGTRVAQGPMPASIYVDPLFIGDVTGNLMTQGLFHIDEVRVTMGASQAQGELTYGVPLVPSNYPQTPRAVAINGSLPEVAYLNENYTSVNNIAVHGPATGVTIVGNAPLGLSASLVGSYVEVTGVPTQLGRYNFSLRVTDGTTTSILPVTIEVKENAWDPSQLSGVAFIIDDESPMTTNGSAVSAWSDRSGTTRSFEQSNTGAQPTLLPAELNGRRAIRTNAGYRLVGNAAANAYLNGVAIAWSFVVYRANGANAADRPVLFASVEGGPGGRYVHEAGAPTQNNRPLVYGRRVAGDNWGMIADGTPLTDQWVMSFGGLNYLERSGRLAVNGAAMQTAEALAFTAGHVSTTASLGTVIGSSQNENLALAGDIACIVAGTGTMPSSQDLDRLFGWAAYKYGLRANLPSNHPYKSIRPARASSPALDPSVTSRLRFDGTSGIASIVDDTGLVWTTSGNAVINNEKARQGGTSLKTTSGYISTARSAALGFGSGPFTVKGWVFPTGSQWQTIFDCRSNNAVDIGLGIYISNPVSGTQRLSVSHNTDLLAHGTIAVPINAAWVHIEVTRDANNVLRGFLNGQLAFSVTDARVYATTAAYYVGSNISGIQPFMGWIDELTVIKGVAEHTTAFTPTT